CLVAARPRAAGRDAIRWCRVSARRYPPGIGHCVDGSGCCALGALFVESHAMGLLTFGLNVTLDGCIDHTQGIVDDELHDYWTQLMDQSGAMLFGRNTYELMEGAWPAVARDEKAPRAMREWAQKIEAKAKYVVSGSRSDFPWQNTIKVEGDLREAISALKAKTERVSSSERPSSRLRSRSWGSSTSTASSFIPSSVAAGRRCFMACRVRGISSSYRRSGSSPACRRSTSVAKRDERGRTSPGGHENGGAENDRYVD